MKEVERYKKKEKLLEEHEYDPDCEYCSKNEFVKDAHVAREKIPLVESEIENYATTLASWVATLERLNPVQVEQHLDKYNKLLNKRTVKESEAQNADLEIARNKNQVIKLKGEVKELSAQIAEYEENREAIENLEVLIAEKSSLTAAVSKYEKSLVLCEQKVMQLYRENGK